MGLCLLQAARGVHLRARSPVGAAEGARALRRAALGVGRGAPEAGPGAGEGRGGEGGRGGREGEGGGTRGRGGLSVLHRGGGGEVEVVEPC